MGKQGIPAFLLDTQLDDKWDLLEARFGLKGFAIAIKLLQRIYGGEGYYCRWDEDISLVFAKNVGADASLVSNIVDFMVRRGLFDSDKFNNLGILTSTTIQKHYLHTKRRATEVVLEGSFLCTNFSKDCYKNIKIVYKNEKNVHRN